ncbi:MAG: formate dehydrogenase accessory sulfurtransferase FdhD [Anaerolineaceae bacterium]|nr:formate dehydrogenase accessory sulfurtransferase FdhD [Anaerolineaceae bacterium]
MSVPTPGALPRSYWLVERERAKLIEGGVIEEALLDIYVNGQELATLMCSPLDQEALALGFLYTEGVIDALGEVALVQANTPRTVVDVLLTRPDFEPPRRMVLTSGCGGGVTMQHIADSYPPLCSDFRAQPEVIVKCMRDLQGAARLYNAVRGVHTAVLADEDQLLLAAEDVGRHNAVDKIAGLALQGGINTRDRLLLTSGRISSEMLSKARRMDIPLVASRTAPTSTAIRLAEAWQLCVVGYVRRGSLRVYTHAWRLGLGERAG